MLHITMPLTTSSSELPDAAADLHAMAAVEINVLGKNKHVNIRLQGAIAGENAAALLDFLKAVSYFVGTHWTLHMKDLKVLSMQGVRHLVHFAEVLRTRGHRLEVRSVHRNVYATLEDLKVMRAFAWAD